MGSTDIFVAKDSFSTTLDGQPVVVQKGVTRVRAGHPLLKGREMFFEPLIVQYDIERATSAPGEKRGEPERPAAPVVRARVEAPSPRPEAAPSKAEQSAPKAQEDK